MSATPSDRIPFGGTHGINCEKTGGSQPCRCSPPSAPREAERLDAVGLQQILHDAADGCDLDEYDEYGREYGNVAEIRHAKAQLRALAAQIPDLLAASARLSASEARAAAAEQRADSEVEIKAEMFDNWTKAEARLASLLEKVEQLPRYRARYDRQDSHANGCSVTINVPLDAFEASAVLSLVRSLLAPSEDTSDG